VIITGHAGPPSRGSEEGVPVIRVPRFPDGRLRRRQLEDYLTHLPASYVALRLGRYDVAHAWYVTDALVAARYKARTGRPAVHSYMGIPDHTGITLKRKRLEITQRALRECDVTVSLAHSVAAEFYRWFGVETPVIQPPVDVHRFSPGPPRTEHPTVIYAADPNAAAKRPHLLVEAFGHIRRQQPNATLWMNRPHSDEMAEAFLSADVGVEFRDLNADLPRYYSEAWVSALPSTGEAFGLVLAEALACGTPGVGTDVGGIPEVLNRPEIGRLFTGGAQELARALLEAFELAQDPSTAEACRARAIELSTERYTTAYEQLYRELLAR
jgi:glycosyltransferase involved in cell wall biosynthesis